MQLKSKSKQDALDLADIASSGMPLAADPDMLEAALRAARGEPSKDAEDLSDIAASGMPLAADPQMLDAGLKGARGYAKGGEVEDKDPSEIPEDVREYIEKSHKETRESRPDEGWRIKGAEKPESIAAYKQDEESADSPPLITPEMINPEEEDHGEGESATGLPHFDDGGEVRPVDQQAIPAAIPPMEMPPMDQPPSAPLQAPVGPASTPQGPTDQDFMNRANKMLGLDPTQSASFMKMLGDRSQGAQLGAGLAGIGDAIASGGTLGKVNPGALKTSEDLIQGREKAGLEGMQSIREGQKESFGLGQTLRGNEPFSPQIQKSLVTQFHIPAALAGSPRDVIYKMLDPIAQTQLKEAELAASQSYKTQALDLQKKQIEATIGNQKAERDIAREGHQAEAAKALAGRGILQTLASAIPGTAGHEAAKTLEKQAMGAPVAQPAAFTPDVIAYAQKHGISPDQAQSQKNRRMGGK